MRYGSITVCPRIGGIEIILAINIGKSSTSVPEDRGWKCIGY